jgi:hypothetical protein
MHETGSVIKLSSFSRSYRVLTLNDRRDVLLQYNRPNKKKDIFVRLGHCVPLNKQKKMKKENVE